MKLNFKKHGNGTPLFILHGVFGSLDNWLTVGKELAAHFTVYLIDQRNHGGSPHSEEMNFQVMADDLVELMDDEGLDRIHLMGHSMGGKTAMHFASKYPKKIDHLIVVDIAPKYYPPHHQEIFEAFHSVELSQINSRKEAEERMSDIIKDFGVRQFILKNLSRNAKKEYEWKINLPVIESNIEIIGGGMESGQKWEGPALFISGGDSDYIKSADHELIYQHFPKAKIEMIAGAGHWVHAVKPTELQELVLDFLPRS